MSVIAGCLAGLAAALMVVGIVSDTVIRHLVQIVPALAAIAIVVRRPHGGAYASIPIFVFWLAIVGLIWAFLLGLSRVANGQYSVVEILCALVMAGCSVVGLATSLRVSPAPGVVQRALIVFQFAAFQMGAMWLSFQPSIVNR